MLHFARWKTTLILLTVISGFFLTLPNFFNEGTLKTWPSWVPSKQMVLGLDLQGGSHLLLQVERDGLVKERLESLRGDVRNLLREDRIRYTNLAITKQGVQVRITDPTKVQDAIDKLQSLANPVSLGFITGQTSVSEVEITQGDGTQLRLILTEEGIQQRIRSAVTQSIEVITKRVNELGTTEPTIQREGDDRILVQVPGLDDPESLKAILGSTAKLTFQMVDTTTSVQEVLNGARPPIGTDLLYDTEDPPQAYLVERRVLVSGEELSDAQPAFDQRTNEPIITFRFNTSGARKFGRATQENVNRPFAIVLDGAVISAPVIREPILGGSGQISGSFTPETANNLAILLRAGALPAELTIIEERTVGPGLGADSIAAGEIAGIIGAIAVIVFMVLSYGLFGILANLALAANILLIMGTLSLLGATLTLPGIAGIVLTVGMAVDANVLIYERIREESRIGRSAIASIDAGFSRALGTILDANITTLIAAVILFSLGSGPIRGFAVTLAVGIVTTVFCAFTFNRFLIAQWVRIKRPTAVPI